ncbi:DUF3054 family protein [Herbiconiux sp. L3-i23]|uniref:DUF3054 family protein n=1 Tax=Herbiconiux sp. L3-i23 TaxID=2905871 RepID=UPI002063FED2|nr:DUF3054 family protein [Herbiconiux sp. L3-i23]BDI22505.1 hypothetical protein L3i23_12810 [Herbiconiux sp. L3-i23]
MRIDRPALVAWAVDAALVAAFVLLGRRSHGEDLAGFATTFLPFFAALQVGWLLRSGLAATSVASGLIVWLTTTILGLLLRLATGDSAELPFVIVTVLVLGVLLLGWRAAWTGIRRLSRSRA